MSTGIKYILNILILLLVSCNQGQSQQAKPQKVYRIVYEIESNEWYNQQAKLWQKEIEKNPKNAQAWYNYYNAHRYAHFEKIDAEDKKARLNKIIEDMGKAIPGTYEYFLLKYWNTYGIHDISLAEKAYQLNPKRPDPYYAFITHYEVTGNEDKVKEFYEKLYESKDIAPWLVNYNYNMLMSIEKNAILFTNGDNDTYPPRMLQVIKSIRNDVTILNIPLSPTKSYLERKLKEKDITIDIKELKRRAFRPDSKKFSIHKFVQELCKMLAERYPDIPIYFALTVMEKHINPIKDDLYIVGLTYQYSTKRIDNLALLKKNVEKNFRLDYLKHDWYNEHYQGKRLSAMMNLNYVALMIKLAEHYKTSGEGEKAQEWKNWALELAKKAGKKELIDHINEI